jgi:hypothetical protein
MRIEIKNGALEVDTTVTPGAKAEEWACSYALMRSGLVGGHGTTLTWVGDHKTRIVPAKGNPEVVKRFMEDEYRKAVKENVLCLREIDVRS